MSISWIFAGIAVGLLGSIGLFVSSSSADSGRCTLEASPTSGPMGTVVTLSSSRPAFLPGVALQFDGTYQPNDGDAVTVSAEFPSSAVHVVDLRTAKIVVGEVLPSGFNAFQLAALGTGQLGGTLTIGRERNDKCSGPVSFAVTQTASFAHLDFTTADRLLIFTGDEQALATTTFKYLAQVQVPDSSQVTGEQPPNQLAATIVNDSGAPDETFAPAEVELSLSLVGSASGLLTYRAGTPIVPDASPLPDDVPSGIIPIYADQGDRLRIVTTGTGQ